MKKINGNSTAQVQLIITFFVGSLIVLSSFFVAQEIVVQPAPKQALLALSKTDHTLAIVDPVTLKVLAHVHQCTFSSHSYLESLRL